MPATLLMKAHFEKEIKKMRKIVVKKEFFYCEICNTKYENPKKAGECEKRKIEKKEFKLGDWVRAKEDRMCMCRGNTEYICIGRIVKIIGPLPPDFEYETKWLGGKPERLNNHVWQYEIGYRCPVCEEYKRARYYAPEIKKVN